MALFQVGWASGLQIVFFWDNVAVAMFRADARDGSSPGAGGVLETDVPRRGSVLHSSSVLPAGEGASPAGVELTLAAASCRPYQCRVITVSRVTSSCRPTSPTVYTAARSIVSSSRTTRRILYDSAKWIGVLRCLWFILLNDYPHKNSTVAENWAKN